MRILKRGRPPEDAPYRVSCRNCKSKLEFEKREAEYVPDQRDGDYLKIECPICKEDVTVSATRS